MIIKHVQNLPNFEDVENADIAIDITLIVDEGDSWWMIGDLHILGKWVWSDSRLNPESNTCFQLFCLIAHQTYVAHTSKKKLLLIPNWQQSKTQNIHDTKMLAFSSSSVLWFSRKLMHCHNESCYVEFRNMGYISTFIHYLHRIILAHGG